VAKRDRDRNRERHRARERQSNATKKWRKVFTTHADGEKSSKHMQERRDQVVPEKNMRPTDEEEESTVESCSSTVIQYSYSKVMILF
jgi:hypothetical protein